MGVIGHGISVDGDPVASMLIVKVVVGASIMSKAWMQFFFIY